MKIKYILGSIVTIPLLPILYFQAKKLRKDFPKLPEAKGIEGISSTSSENTIRIITIGESTIAGVGANTHQEAFTGTLANELSAGLKTNVSWKVYAKSGYSAKKVNDKIIDTIDDESIDLIVIGIGGNDAFELNTPRKWNKNIRELITNIRNKFKVTPIVFLNMPSIKEFPAFTSLMKFSIGNLVNILGEEVAVIVKDFDEVFFFNEKTNYSELISKYNLQIKFSEFFSDGVHPSAITYQVWAKELSSFIIQSKEIKNSLKKFI